MAAHVQRSVAIWIAALVLIMAAGAVAIGIRVQSGLVVTNLTSITPWGAWVAFYIYFVGLSAGAFLLSTLIYVFGMERFEKIGRAALLTAIVSMVVALIFVLLDLGRMDRFLNALIYWNLTSVLAWEVHFYVVYIALLMAELYLSMRQDLILAAWGSGWKARVCRALTLGSRDLSPASRQRDLRWLKMLGTIGIPLAIFGVHGGTGAIFAVAKARPYWNTGLFPIIFVVSALVSGTALLTLFYVIREKVLGRPVDRGLVTSLARLMAAFLLVDLGLQFYEFLVALYGLEHAEMATLSAMATSRFSWSFWFVQLLLGAALPLFLVFGRRTRESVAALTGAAALVVVGILAVRFNIVVPPLVVPVMEGLPGGDYYPTLVEWVSSAGIIAFGLLLYILGVSALPVDAQDHEGSVESEQSAKEVTAGV